MKINTVRDLLNQLKQYSPDTKILSTAESVCTPIGGVYLSKEGTLLIDVDADPGGQYKKFFQSGRLNPRKRIEPPIKERVIFPGFE